MSYCMYLRKSRADAEQSGTVETLARHRKALELLAKQKRLDVTAVYEEIVSGESIAARPEMLRLLSDVEQGAWEGVLVMEVERLARGNTSDQGIVAQTFKYSDTLIITPQKTYDPNDPIDEEYFEFSLFMSRREYKAINRRLVAGRIASLRSGLWIYNVAPYGYDIQKNKGGKGFILVPNPDEAPVIAMIFEWFVNGIALEDGKVVRYGSTRIAKRLNAMGIRTNTGGLWTTSAIASLLRNETFIGKIRYQRRANKKTMRDGKVVISRAINQEYQLYDGLHKHLVSDEVFYQAREILARNRTIPLSVADGRKAVNPLAGLLVCAKCGHKLRYQHTRTAECLACPNESCDSGTSVLSVVEQHLLDALQGWLTNYMVSANTPTVHTTDESITAIQSALAQAEREKASIARQIDRTHELLEQEVYDIATFKIRSKALEERRRGIEENVGNLRRELARIEAQENARATLLPKVQHVLQAYHGIDDIAAKNAMLKEVIDHVEYHKERGGTRWNPKEMTLKVFVKVPSSII